MLLRALVRALRTLSNRTLQTLAATHARQRVTHTSSDLRLLQGPSFHGLATLLEDACRPFEVSCVDLDEDQFVEPTYAHQWIRGAVRKSSKNSLGILPAFQFQEHATGPERRQLSVARVVIALRGDSFVRVEGSAVPLAAPVQVPDLERRARHEIRARATVPCPAKGLQRSP